MLKQEEKSTLEILTEETNRQMNKQIPKNLRNNYGAARGNILSELRRLYIDFEKLVNKPYYFSGCKGYGNCAVFSSKSYQPLKVQVSVKDFGTKYDCSSLELIQETPSIEISRMPKLSKDTKIFSFSNLRQINLQERENAIDDALSFVGDVANENGKVKFGVTTKKGIYGVTLPKESLPIFTLRFLKGDFRLEKDLGEILRRQFDV